MHYIINPALPWYVYLIAVLLSLLFVLCLAKLTLYCYRLQRRRRSQNSVQYVMNPVFNEDETYEVPVPVTQQQ